MRIALKPLLESGSYGTPVSLCDGHSPGVSRNVGPSDLRTTGPILVQDGRAVRAVSARPRNRKNLQPGVAFSVLRELGSGSAAELYCFTWIKTCPREGTLEIVSDGGKVTIEDAVVQDVQCTQIGCSVQIGYQITGGAIT